jgi:hydrogenase expression/formation protein HypC
MCIAVPLRVVQIIEGDRALVEQGDLVRDVNIGLLSDVCEGDYVLVNLGVAVQKLSESEAQGILDLWDQVTLSLLDEYLDELNGDDD